MINSFSCKVKLCCALMLLCQQLYSYELNGCLENAHITRDTSKSSNTLEGENIQVFPNLSVQQVVKGQLSGILVKESSSEPGSVQGLYFRGTSSPIFSKQDVYYNEPLVVVDGIPVFNNDHPLAFALQQYDFNRLGPATNLLAFLDINNIQDIKILRDYTEVSQYGPRAANGVILVTTKRPVSKRLLSLSTYAGMATRPQVETWNGRSEYNFRKPFFDAFATTEQRAGIPAYLRDSLYNIYYGPSNWTDIYYRNAPQFGANLSLTGGSERSNFRASLGVLDNNGIADDVGLKRYNANFVMFMQPTDWLDISTAIDGNRLDRNRNRYLRDRYAEIRYLPNLVNPLSPNKDYYQSFVNEYKKSFDDNFSNIVSGFMSVGAKFNRLKLNSRGSLSYNQGYRDIFYPSTIMETNSYVSNYFGYNQRLMWDNSISYDFDLGNQHNLYTELGSSVQFDTYRYDYGYAYRGVSDYIKVNLLDDPYKPLTASFYYQPNNGFVNTLTFRYLDEVKDNLALFHTKFKYNFAEKYGVNFIVRRDGSSSAQPTVRWFNSFATSFWAKVLEKKQGAFNEVRFHGGFSRLGKLSNNDRFGSGPQYITDIGYDGEPRVGSYSAVATLGRPYSLGWIGYDLPWAYSVNANIGFDIAILNDFLQISTDFYSRDDKNQIVTVPDYAEYGYKYTFRPGMTVRNYGVDFSATSALISKNSFSWTSSLNFNFNRNKLMRLPNNINSITLEGRRLEIGTAVDRFWVYENIGRVNNTKDIPINPLDGKSLSFEGVPFEEGDPIWKDNNNDYLIDDSDKVLKGNILPVLSGGFKNNLTYKGVSLDVFMYYNIGNNALNQSASNKFDFINQESTHNMNSVKEVTFWESSVETERYPLYNPWSDVTPYRVDQDLFLENASFLKLRNVTLGYDFKNSFGLSKLNLKKIHFYISANNLFTITGYSGRDPEMIDYRGIDSGYGHYFTKTFLLGFKIDM